LTSELISGGIIVEPKHPPDYLFLKGPSAFHPNKKLDNENLKRYEDLI
jgi:hypothetical protein